MASQAAIVSVLSNLEDLCDEDNGLEAALRCTQIVTDGTGKPAQISELFDPAVSELAGLLGPEAFPASVFCLSAVRLHCFAFLCVYSLVFLVTR